MSEGDGGPGRNETEGAARVREWSGLAPGLYGVRLSIGRFQEVSLSDVLVQAGGTTREPRLIGCHLGSDLEEREVRVHSSLGEPLTKALIEGRDQVGHWFDRPDESGACHYLARRGRPVQFVVEASGYRTWRGESRKESLVVRLERED